MRSRIIRICRLINKPVSTIVVRKDIQTVKTRHILISSGHKYDYCPSGHSNDYCSQYVLGYGDEWNRSIQKDFGTEQTQGTSVDIHGNNNKVKIEQGQQSTDNGFSGSSSSHGQNPVCKAFCVVVN